MYNKDFQKELNDAYDSIPKEYMQEMYHSKLKIARYWACLLLVLVTLSEIFPRENVSKELKYIKIAFLVIKLFLFGASYFNLQFVLYTLYLIQVRYWLNLVVDEAS